MRMTRDWLSGETAAKVRESLRRRQGQCHASHLGDRRAGRPKEMPVGRDCGDFLSLTLHGDVALVRDAHCSNSSEIHRVIQLLMFYSSDRFPVLG